MMAYLKSKPGRLLQMLIGILGFLFFFIGFITCMTAPTIVGGVYLFLGILCWCVIGGVRYWLGHMVRNR